MSQLLFHILVLIGFGLPSAGFLWNGSLIPAALLAFTGSAWVIFERRGLAWAASTALLLGISGSAYGSWAVLGPLSSISSAICLLMAWNLAQFHKFTRKAAPDDDLTIVEQRHIIKTLGFGLTALGISLAGVYVQIRVTFFQAVALLVLAIIGIMQMVRWILTKRESLNS